MFKLAMANAVLLTKELNVALLQQLWFVQNGIVKAEEFSNEPGTIFSPVAVHFTTPAFELFAVSERLQVTMTTLTSESHATLTRVVGGVAKALNASSSFSALGFNFLYTVQPEGEANFAERTKRIFLPDTHPWIKEFSTKEARFGGYVSRDFSIFRQKIECGPILANEREGMQLNANFHVEISDANKLDEALSKWPECAKVAEELCLSMSAYLDTSENKKGAMHA